MKPIIEWDEAYLLNLPSGEYDWIEKKESRKLDFNLPQVDVNQVSNELSKQVSAFANSGGGTIVYGLEDCPVGKPQKIDSNGGVSLNLRNGTKEWLEDIIPNIVDSPIARFNVYVLTNQNSTNSAIADNKGIFLIEIPSSDQAPHQANDNKYYARVGGKSRPIGHRLVSDIFGRAKYPQLALYCLATSTNNDDLQPITLTFSCMNVGRIFANYVNGYVTLPDFLLKDKLKLGKDTNSFRIISIENIEKDVVGYMTHQTPRGPLTSSRYKPVLPGLRFDVKVPLVCNFFELSKLGITKINWTIYADNAPPVIGEFTIKDILDGKTARYEVVNIPLD